MSRLRQSSLRQQVGITPSASEAKPKKRPAKSKGDPLQPINIKLPRSQREWLGKTSQQVRDNNPPPVSGPDRVFPQHLITVAVELLQDADVDWSQVKNAQDLRNLLGLS